MSSKRPILVAMSGGVDSSVAAARIVDEGHSAIGIFMRLGTPDEAPEGSQGKGCCSVGDAEDARAVAHMLGMPLHVISFRREFGKIIDHFVDEYISGRTPNPCVRCNEWLKFGRLHQVADDLGASAVASGHHARIINVKGKSRLARGLDFSKDQSYVLFGASGKRLDEMLLPVGEMTKDEVRAEAKERGLPVASKPDSQEICFVPDDNYSRLIREKRPESFKQGAILSVEGKIIGNHSGHINYTIGQRRGVGLALGHPVYVVDKNPDQNTVTVGSREDLLSMGMLVNQITWHEEKPINDFSCLVQWRAHGHPVKANAKFNSDGFLKLIFEKSQQAVAPGQAVVCYQDDMVLGGGWIDKAIRN